MKELLKERRTAQQGRYFWAGKGFPTSILLAPGCRGRHTGPSRNVDPVYDRISLDARSRPGIRQNGREGEGKLPSRPRNANHGARPFKADGLKNQANLQEDTTMYFPPNGQRRLSRVPSDRNSYSRSGAFNISKSEVGEILMETTPNVKWILKFRESFES